MVPESAARSFCLRARDIVVKREGRIILNGATMEVEGGTVTTLRGASGSGKSTFLRVLGLLTEPDAGSVWLGDVDTRSMTPEAYRRRVAYVAQAPQMLEGTVTDNLTAGPRFHGRSIDEAALASLLARVALDTDFRKRSARDLSGGERVRVALARALANDPEVILLDEPTAALDPASAGRILELVGTLARSGVAVLVVTHSEGDTRTLAGTNWVCRDGALFRDEEAT